MLSSVWYNGVALPGADPKSAIDYVRIPLSATIQFPLSGRLAMGLGGGEAVELPLFHGDTAIVGPLHNTPMALVTTDFWLTKLIGLEAAIRGIPEQTVTYSAPSFAGVPTHSVSSAWSWFGEIKLRVGR